MKKSSSMRGCFFHAVKRQHKKHGWYPSQSVLRASQNQAAALNRMKILRQPCSCRPGMRAHAARDGIRAFAMGYHIFYESAESVSLPRRRGAGGENREPVYRDS